MYYEPLTIILHGGFPTPDLLPFRAYTCRYIDHNFLTNCLAGPGQRGRVFRAGVGTLFGRRAKIFLNFDKRAGLCECMKRTRVLSCSIVY